MPTINQSYQTICKSLGKNGQKVFSKKEFLKNAEKIDKDLAKIIDKSLEGIENPSFKLFSKSTYNTNIALLKIQNGNKTIGSGAISKTQSDLLEGSVIKGRLDLPDGNILRMDGDLSEEAKLNIYKGKNRDLIRISSAEDNSYSEISERFGNYIKFKEFDGKTNEYKTLWKYNNVQIDNVKIAKNERGFTKISADYSGHYPFEKVYDNKGKKVAETISNGLTKDSVIYDKDGNEIFSRTLHLKHGKPMFGEYNFTETAKDGKKTHWYMQTHFDEDVAVENLDNVQILNSKTFKKEKDYNKLISEKGQNSLDNKFQTIQYYYEDFVDNVMK